MSENCGRATKSEREVFRKEFAVQGHLFRQAVEDQIQVGLSGNRYVVLVHSLPRWSRLCSDFLEDLDLDLFPTLYSIPTTVPRPRKQPAVRVQVLEGPIQSQGLHSFAVALRLCSR